MTLHELALAIVRDRREPDKMLLYAMQLKRAANDLDQVARWAFLPEGDADIRLIKAWEILRETTDVSSERSIWQDSAGWWWARADSVLIGPCSDREECEASYTTILEGLDQS